MARKYRAEWNKASILLFVNDFCLGGIGKNEIGWRFIPLIQAKPSRKHWDNPVDAIKGRLPKEAVDAVRDLWDLRGEEARAA